MYMCVCVCLLSVYRLLRTGECYDNSESEFVGELIIKRNFPRRAEFMTEGTSSPIIIERSLLRIPR